MGGSRHKISYIVVKGRFVSDIGGAERSTFNGFGDRSGGAAAAKTADAGLSRGETDNTDAEFIAMAMVDGDGDAVNCGSAVGRVGVELGVMEGTVGMGRGFRRRREGWRRKEFWRRGRHQGFGR